VSCSLLLNIFMNLCKCDIVSLQPDLSAATTGSCGILRAMQCYWLCYLTATESYHECHIRGLDYHSYWSYQGLCTQAIFSWCVYRRQVPGSRAARVAGVGKARCVGGANKDRTQVCSLMCLDGRITVYLDHSTKLPWTEIKSFVVYVTSSSNHESSFCFKQLFFFACSLARHPPWLLWQTSPTYHLLLGLYQSLCCCVGHPVTQLVKKNRLQLALSR
jgi:hypothetical protein